MFWNFCPEIEECAFLDICNKITDNTSTDNIKPKSHYWEWVIAMEREKKMISELKGERQRDWDEQWTWFNGGCEWVWSFKLMEN